MQLGSPLSPQPFGRTNTSCIFFNQFTFYESGIFLFQMQTNTAMLLLLLVIYTCGAAAAGGVVVSSSAHDTSDSSVSISMPVQYSMAAPAYSSGQLAAIALTSAAPTHKTITTTHRPSPDEWIPKMAVQPSQPIPKQSSKSSVSRAPITRRMTFSAGYAASEPLFESHDEYKPQYHHKPPTYTKIKSHENPKIRQPPPSNYEHYISHTPPPHPPIHEPYISHTPPPHPPLQDSYISYTPPPSYQQHYQPYVYSKPNFLKYINPYKPSDHDFIDFPVYSHKGSLGAGSNSYYKYLVPFALLGISLPAIGLMYTYFNRRRRRDLRSDVGSYLHPSEEDLEYYFNLLQRSIQRFQERMDSEMTEKKKSKRAD